MISTVIYFIGKVLTFPGAYIKAFFEHLIARAFSIPVEDTKYLRFTDGCGHVEHDAIGSKAKIKDIRLEEASIDDIIRAAYNGGSAQ